MSTVRETVFNIADELDDGPVSGHLMFGDPRMMCLVGYNFIIFTHAEQASMILEVMREVVKNGPAEFSSEPSGHDADYGTGTTYALHAQIELGYPKPSLLDGSLPDIAFDRALVLLEEVVAIRDAIEERLPFRKALSAEIGSK